MASRTRASGRATAPFTTQATEATRPVVSTAPATVSVTGSGAPSFSLATATIPKAAHITTAPTPTGITTSALRRPPGLPFGSAGAGDAARTAAFVAGRRPSVLRRVISVRGGPD